MNTLIEHKEGNYNILISENVPEKGLKSTFESILNPLGKKNDNAICLIKGCGNKAGNKKGICANGKHQKSLDLLLTIEDSNRKALKIPSFVECVLAIRYYEKQYNEDGFLELIKYVARTHIGKIPPYYIINSELKGFYDVTGNLVNAQPISNTIYLTAFNDIILRLKDTYKNGSNACDETYRITTKSYTFEYSFSIYMITFLWLILIEEINRGDRWISKQFYNSYEYSKNSGGAMAIILYWAYKFPWGSDIATGNTRVPIHVSY